MTPPSPTTILCVDDDPTNRRLFALALQEEGFQVWEAATGAEAVRLAHDKPDLIILDVQLPDVSGFEVCARIKADPATSAIPVLHLSGVARAAHDKAEGLGGGADGYLIKPVELKELLAHVKALLRIRRAEQAAREAARQWQTTFDAISDAVCLVDLQSNVLRCNRVMAALLGKTPDQVVGQSFVNLVRAAGGRPEALAVAVSPDARGPEVRETALGERWFHVTADPVVDAEGVACGTAHVWLDLTDRKRAEDALRVEEERTRLIIQTAYDAFVAVGADGRVLDWNRQAERTFGWSRAEALGRPLAEVAIPPRYWENHLRGFAHMLAAGDSSVLNRFLEVWGRTKEGREFPAEVMLSLVRYGKDCQFNAFVRDVTARKLAERHQSVQLAVSQALVESATLAEATTKILQAVCEITEWDAGAVWRVDPQSGVLRCVETWSAPSVDAAAFAALTQQLCFTPGDGLPGRVWTTRAPAWLPEVAVDAASPRGQAAVLTGLRAALAVPVPFGTEVTGVLEFFSRKALPPDELLCLLGAPSSQIGQFFERKRAEEAVAEGLRLSAFSAAVGAALRQTDTLAAMLRGCTDAMIHCLGAALGRIWTFDPETDLLELQASSGLYTHVDGAHSRVPLGDLESGQIAQEHQPYWTNHAADDPRIAGQDWARREGLTAFAGYPLMAAGRLVGVLALFARGPLSDVTLQALASAADSIALGVERRVAEKTLHATQEEFRVARQIQQKLFPRSGPQAPGFDIGGASYSAVSTGGDYYDFFPLSDGALGVVIADVSGHGVGPALLMASTRAYLRALGLTHSDVSEMLALTNRALVEDTEGQFVTLLLARLDTASRSFIYASAGHPTGYVLDAQGGVKARLKSTGMPLGILPNADFPCSDPVTLEPDEMALFLTDGVVEARAPDNAVFGAERALSIARICRHESALRIVENLFHAVRAFARDLPQQDDVSAVVVKALAAPPPA